MATYMPSPGHFKGADADPETTLELFQDYLEKMEKVFRLSRDLNPVTGLRVDWDSKEKKDMLVYLGDTNFPDLVWFSVPVLKSTTFLCFFLRSCFRVGTFTGSFFGSFSETGTFLMVFSWPFSESNSCPTIQFLEYFLM